MQSKGWIWQACLLLTVSLTFSSVLPLPSAFSQTETTPEKQAEPKSDDDKNDMPSELSEEEAAPKAGDNDESAESKQKDDSDDQDTQKDDEATNDQEEPTQTASELLSEAFLLKLDARTTPELDKIVTLCEAALKKGLDENETEQANFLASESLLRFAEGMAKRVFATPQDRRWRIYRTQAIPRLRKAIEFNESNVAAFLLLAKFEAMDPNTKAEALKNLSLIHI